MGCAELTVNKDREGGEVGGMVASTLTTRCGWVGLMLGRLH